MRSGELVQVGDPPDLYDRPVDGFAARFIGDSNVVRCDLVSEAEHVAIVKLPGGQTAPVATPAGAQLANGRPVSVMLRPEALEVAPLEHAHFVGAVTESVFLGAYWRHELRAEGETVVRFVTSHGGNLRDKRVGLRIRDGSGVVLADPPDAASPVPASTAPGVPQGGITPTTLAS
jgi:ABC-type Fe3+/spermidine/putrescine transport system ATPase subunit